MTESQAPHDPVKQTGSTETARRADSIGAHVVAFFAGMLGGLAFAQLPNGSFIGVILGYASSLPVFLSGLTGGRTVAITACACAILAAYLRLGGEWAAIFALLVAVPTMVLTRVALIDFGAKEAPRYINASAILLTALAIGTLLMSVAATGFALYSDGISAAVAGFVDSAKETLQQTPTIREEQIEPTLAFMRKAFPSMLLVTWFTLISVLGLVGQYIAAEMRRNLRPTPKLKEIVLPLWLSVLFLICFAASFATGPDLSMVLGAFATLYGIGLVISGMAEMHRRIDAHAAQSGWSDLQRKALYIFIYVTTFVLTLPVFFMLLIGLIAPFTFQRHKPRTVTPNGQ